MVKRIFIIFTTTLLLSACSIVNKSEKETPVELPKNSLTGLVGSDNPILAVKIDDTKAAHPQIGVEDADVVYVEQVEAGLTRLLAIYSSHLPERIGPVRSVRISDIELLAQYGRVGFAYSGAQSQMRPVVAAANLIDLGAERNSPSIYTRASDRSGPVDMVLLPKPLMAKAIEKNKNEKAENRIAMAKPMGWTFGESSMVGRAVDSVKVNWPNASYEARWSKVEKRWLLWHDGNPDMAESGMQLGSATIVIQIVEIAPSIYGDKFGGVTPKSTSIGTGAAYILRDSQILPVTWQRDNESSGTSFTNGEIPVNFSPGQVWFLLTDQLPDVTYSVTPSASASPTKSK